MVIDKPIRTTLHFSGRLRECGLRYHNLLYILPLAEIVKAPKNIHNKYSKDGMRHCQYGSLIFTFTECLDKSQDKLGQIYLLLTVFDKRFDATPRGLASQSLFFTQQQEIED